MLHISPWQRFAAMFGALVASFAFTSFASATGWVDAASPTTTDLYGMDCGTSNVCIGVGPSGTVVYNSGSRTAWSLGTSGVSTTLHNVSVYETNLAIAVGNGGVILRSTDRGATWTSIASGTTEDLYDVVMVSTTIGWAGGEDSKIFKTTDGGLTWTNVFTTGSIDVRAIDATSALIVWASGKNGAIYRSGDGGTTWTDVSIGTTNTLWAIDATSSTTAYVGGDNRMLKKTTDSGATWSSLILPDFGVTEAVSDLEFTTSSIGTVVGNAGIISSTTDGSTFTADTLALTTTGVYDVSLVATGSRFAGGASGGIYIYDDYGPEAPENLVMTDGDYTNDTTPTFTWDAAVDNEGAAIANYEISVDGSSWGTLDTSTSHTPTIPFSMGSKTIYVRAIDEVGNTGDAASVNFAVEQTDPTVGTVSPTSATAGTSTQFTVTASDASGIDSCTLYVNAVSQGAMTLDGTSGEYYRSHTFSAAGTYSAYASCTDAAGNSTTSSSASIAVAAATTSSDTTGPTVSAPSPTTATTGSSTSISVTASDSSGVDYCTLSIDGSSVGTMTSSGSTFSRSYTFSSSGSYTARAVCVDEEGNSTTGSSTTITVTGASSEEETADDEADEGDLLKMACPGGEDVNDPCRAVYFYGDDGKRHAFPNEKVFFTWYSDFDDVVIVTDDYMASLTLGRNVTYHPGSKLVKYPSVRTVYAVGEEGELRAIASEDIAISLYGSSWNTKVDDISEAFYSNYTYGDDIDSSSDYDVSDAEDAMDSILDLF